MPRAFSFLFPSRYLIQVAHDWHVEILRITRRGQEKPWISKPPCSRHLEIFFSSALNSQESSHNRGHGARVLATMSTNRLHSTPSQPSTGSCKCLLSRGFCFDLCQTSELREERHFSSVALNRTKTQKGNSHDPRGRVHCSEWGLGLGFSVSVEPPRGQLSAFTTRRPTPSAGTEQMGVKVRGWGSSRTWDFCALWHKEIRDNLQVLTSTSLESIVVICVQRFEILKVPSS